MRPFFPAAGFLFALTAPVLAQPAPVIDNERVTVWDVRLQKGESLPALSPHLDTVVMFLEGGKIAAKSAAGKDSVAVHKFGDAVFVPKETGGAQTLLSDAPAHEIIFALKDSPSVIYKNTSGLPPAFPRPGSVKVLDNAKVVVWHYSWTPGKPTHMHFHDKDVVLAYRFDGSLKSITPDGKSVINDYKAGDIRFNRGNRMHYEELTTARQSAVMAELK